MAYVEHLADRVREMIASLTAFEERKMFGGLTFMVNTHMACGIVKDDLMVRVGKDGHVAALARGAQEMDFTGRPMRGMVIVPGSEVVDESPLDGWVALPWRSRGHSHPRRATTLDSTGVLGRDARHRSQH